MAIVGIDLGTTKSAVAVLRGNGPEIIPNHEGDRITPSVVGLSKAGELWIGKRPKESRLVLKDGPVEEVKRLMGSTERLTFNGRDRSPQEISSYILRALKSDAEAFLGEKVNCAVITIPAYFNEPERRATREAGELAGLYVGAVLDEPTAAALAYGLGKTDDQTILVYDLGGGTFDVSILEVADNHFEVLGISGNKRLGGKDFDRRLSKWVIDQVKQKHGVDLAADRRAMHKVVLAVEKAKKELSSSPQTGILIEAATPDLDVDLTISRAQFEALIKDYIDSTIPCIEEALDKAELMSKEIDKVVLVGGSTRIPGVQSVVRKYFSKEPLRDINPDEAVALGAAIFTSILGEDVKKKFIPAAKMEEYELKDAQGEVIKPVAVPRTPHALGIGLAENKLAVILEENSFYPISVTRKEFGTVSDDQPELEVPVYEGRNPVATENTPLGIVHLDLPDGLRRGSPVWVTFTLNDSRILEVTVEIPNAKTKAKATAVIKGTSDLDPEERERIIREAREAIGARSPIEMAKALLREGEDTLEMNKGKIAGPKASAIERQLLTLRAAIEAMDSSLIDKACTELTRLLRDVRYTL